jgi:hypothetical protein
LPADPTLKQWLKEVFQRKRKGEKKSEVTKEEENESRCKYAELSLVFSKL